MGIFMGAVESVEKAINILTKHLVLAAIPILVAFALIPVTLHGPEFFPLTNQSVEVAKEQLKSSVQIFVRASIISGVITSILQAVSKYYVSAYTFDVINGKKPQEIQTIIESVKNLPQVTLLNLLSWIITVLPMIPPFAYLYIKIMEAESFGISAGVMNIFFLLTMLALTILLYVVPASMLLVPAYVKTKSIRSSLSIYRTALRKLPSVIGFGILVLVIMAIISLPAIITKSINSKLLAEIIKAPFTGLANAFSLTAAALFYLWLAGERIEKNILEEGSNI